MAKGMGLMGEAGAEAIMPLSRTSGGDLGVKMEGGGTNVNVNVQNYGNDEVEVRADRRQYKCYNITDSEFYSKRYW